jgi:hypothetical protein
MTAKYAHHVHKDYFLIIRSVECGVPSVIQDFEVGAFTAPVVLTIVTLNYAFTDVLVTVMFTQAVATDAVWVIHRVPQPPFFIVHMA